jgi:hypothetical protein
MANGNSVTTNKLKNVCSCFCARAQAKANVNWDSLEVKTFNQDITLKMVCDDII